MIPPAISPSRSPLTLPQAVALSLLRDGYTAHSIKRRTGTDTPLLYTLAVQHGIQAPHGTLEGGAIHDARGEERCEPCEKVAARQQAREYARHRTTLASLPPSRRRSLTRHRIGAVR